MFLNEKIDNELMEELLSFSGEKWRPVYEKAFRRLHPDLIRSELREVQVRLRAGQCAHPGKMLTHFLKAAIAKHGLKPLTLQKKKKPSPFAPDIPTLASEIPKEEAKRSEMDLLDGGNRNVYGKRYSPWPSLMGPEFFAPAGYKKRRDKVSLTIKTADGQRFQVPMIRGAMFASDSEEWKIMDTDDRNIMRSMTEFWRIQGGPTFVDKLHEGRVLCHCTFDVNTLAEILGYKTEGRSIGSSRRKLASKVAGLQKAKYYVDLRSVKGLEDFKELTRSLSFVSDVTIISAKSGRGQKLMIHVLFSEFYSNQILGERCVSRSLPLVRIREPIASQLAEYLQRLPRERRLAPISFTRLIEFLALPEAGWHKIASKRARHIGAAIKKVNGKQVSKRLVFDLRVVKKPDDFYLIPGFLAVSELLVPALDAEEKKIREAVLRDSHTPAFYGTNGQQITHENLPRLKRLYWLAPFVPSAN